MTREWRQSAQRPRRELAAGDDLGADINWFGRRENQFGLGGSADSAGGAGALGLANCESLRGILVSILVAVIFWIWSESVAADSTRKGYFRPSTSRKSRK